jgi:hypothetical protein
MRNLFKLVSVVTVALGFLYFVAVGQFEAQAGESASKIHSLDKAVHAQRSWNKQHEERIRVKSRMTAVLSNFGDSMHHDPAQMAELILSKCERAGLDPFLILAMIKAESDFNSRAVSSEGAMGLMQIKPETASLLVPYGDFGPENSDRLLLDNDLNISLGTMYLAKLIHRFGDVDVALEAYNKGPDGMLTLLSAGVDEEGRYAGKVKNNYRKYKYGSLAKKRVKRGLSS